MTSVIALVQARMGSTRLPGKCMADVCGAPVLAHVLRRVNAATLVDCTVLCIPDTPENDVLAELGEAEGVEVYRGSESDVLARLYWASQLHPDAPCIVRITGEDAAKPPELIDRAIEGFLSEWGRELPDAKLAPPQYLHLGGATWPMGMDVEVVTRDALEMAHLRATDTQDREHAGMPWIRRTFGVWTLKDDPVRLPGHIRLTVDTADDLDAMRRLHAALGPGSFGYDDIVGFLQHAGAA